MTTELRLPDVDIEAGIPFVIQVRTDGPGELPHELHIVPKDLPTLPPFTAPVVVHAKSLGTAELRLTFPGTYEVRASSQVLAFQVKDHKDLSFGAEFGFFLVLTLVAFGAILARFKRMGKGRYEST